LTQPSSGLLTGSPSLITGDHLLKGHLTIDTIGNLLRRGDVALSASFMSEAATLRIPR
jgi:hypothetical protein